MAAPYVDVYVLPLPKKNLALYRRIANAAGKIFRDNGAIEYREFVVDDLKTMKGVSPWTRYVKLRRGEVLITSVVGYRSRAQRDKANVRIMNDPRMSKIMPANTPMPFDMKRMAYGGFKRLVDV